MQTMTETIFQTSVSEQPFKRLHGWSRWYSYTQN